MLRLKTLLDAGAVERLHTVPTIGRHTIAQHTYGALIIAMELCAVVKAYATSCCLSVSCENVMRTLLVHDASELDTGDVPAPVKRSFPALREAYEELDNRFMAMIVHSRSPLNYIESDIVKASDVLDLGMTCLHERRLGNLHPRIERVYLNVRLYLKELAPLPGVPEIEQYLVDEWDQL